MKKNITFILILLIISLIVVGISCSALLTTFTFTIPRECNLGTDATTYTLYYSTDKVDWVKILDTTLNTSEDVSVSAEVEPGTYYLRELKIITSGNCDSVSKETVTFIAGTDYNYEIVYDDTATVKCTVDVEFDGDLCSIKSILYK